MQRFVLFETDLESFLCITHLVSCNFLCRLGHNELIQAHTHTGQRQMHIVHLRRFMPRFRCLASCVLLHCFSSSRLSRTRLGGIVLGRSFLNRRVHEGARYKHLTLSQMGMQLFGWRARLELARHNGLVSLYLVHGRRGYSCKQGIEARLEFV